MRRIRVAAHVHSDWSYDGRWGLRDIANAFGRLGYAAVLLAEHDRGFTPSRWTAYREACAEASTAKALLVPGLEYSNPSNSVHLPVWGEVPFLGEGIETSEMLRRIADVGGLAVLAHPGRRDVWRRLEQSWLDNLLGIELWNRKYDGYAPNRVAAELLQDQTQLLPFVSLDFHTARQFHPLAMVFDVAGDVTETEICDAMRNRRARPIAFGAPALAIARGSVGLAMREIELTRRRGASVARRLGRAGRRRLPVRPASR